LEEVEELLRHQGVDDVEDEERHARAAEDVGLAQELEAPEHRRREPALEDDAQLLVLAGYDLVERVRRDVSTGGGEARLELLGLLRVRGGGMGDAGVVEGVASQAMAHAEGGAAVGAAGARRGQRWGPGAEGAASGLA